MTRAALLAAGLLTLAACSSGGEAEPPPPLDTEAPTTTVEAPPTTEAPETTTSTTATSTTTLPETTTTVLTIDTPATDPPVSIDPDVVAAVDAVVAEAFVEYEETWHLIRSAFENPTDESIREQLSRRYAEGSGKSLFDGLNQFADSNQRSLSPEPGEPQGVVLVRSVSAVEGVFAAFQTCETFSSPVVDATSGEPTYEGIDSTLREVQMLQQEGVWLVRETVTIESFVGPACE